MANCRLALPPRRGMTDADCAAYLGRSQTWLAEHRAKLEAASFPPKLPLIENYDRKAIDAWLDQQGRLDAALHGFEDAWMKAANHG
jgi:hypothetical protein